jgi:hypothetical protein
MQNALATRKSFYHEETFPLPGSLSEQEAFSEIQSQFSRQFEQYFPDKLAEKGVIGRFSIDFISVKEADAWKHYGIEINLRKGGTTHPLLMLQFLTDGEYNADTGAYFRQRAISAFTFHRIMWLLKSIKV